MENFPNLEVWIRYGEMDFVVMGRVNCFLKPWMYVPIKHGPE